MELELNTPIIPMPVPPRKDPLWKRTAAWLVYRGRMTLRFDTPLWRAGIFGLWAVLVALLVVTALGMPTGIGIAFDAAAAVVLGTLLMGAASFAAAYLLALCYVPIPRLTAGALAFTGFAIWYIGDKASLGDWMSIVLAILLAAVGLAVGLLIGLLAHRRVPVILKIALVVAIALAGVSFDQWPMNVYGDVPADAQMITEEPEVAQIMADNPADEGAYPVKSFTYGSSDSKQDEFGSGAALTSKAVDASAYIHRWKWLRACSGASTKPSFP